MEQAACAALRAQSGKKKDDTVEDYGGGIRYIGVNDHDIDLFEGQYVVENGHV